MLYTKQTEILSQINFFAENIIILSNEHNWTDNEIIKFAVDLGIPWSEQTIKQYLSFGKDPLWNSYIIFLYNQRQESPW